MSEHSVNYWPESACARAFWGQQDLPPYRELLADTVAWIDPEPGADWLDLGCGSGQLTKAIWNKSQGILGTIVGMDFAPANQRAFHRMAAQLLPAPAPEQVRFCLGDFSEGLTQWPADCFDGIVSGLAVQYASSFSADRDCWSRDAYDKVLTEVHRVLRNQGRFVFSVNVPEPAWRKVAWQSLSRVFTAERPLRYLKKAARMMSYGSWLKRESRRGRFHYLPIETIRGLLQRIGFTSFQYRLSYADQAFVIRCRK